MSNGEEGIEGPTDCRSRDSSGSSLGPKHCALELCTETVILASFCGTRLAVTSSDGQRDSCAQCKPAFVPGTKDLWRVLPVASSACIYSDPTLLNSFLIQKAYYQWSTNTRYNLNNLGLALGIFKIGKVDVYRIVLSHKD